MANDLKAVVEITADTKGLVTGIAGATKSISEGTSQISELFKFHALKKGLELVKDGFEMVSQHYEELYNTAVQYSPAAAMANNNLAMTKVRADQITAAASAPDSVAISRMREQAAMNEARRNLNAASEGNTGATPVEQIASNMNAAKAITTEKLANVASGNISMPTGMWGALASALGPIGMIQSLVTDSRLFDQQSYVYADQATPGRGMAGSAEFEAATQHLAAIREKMGGQ